MSMERFERPGTPEWLILAGASLFMAILLLTGVMEADIRWLHFFQAWMYVATIILALRRSRWGYFIGIAAAGAWDYANLFATTFFFNGLHWLGQWMRTGELQRVDQIIAVPAWVGNLLVVIGCLWAYLRMRPKRASDLARFAVALALSTGFFALDMALFQPRYLVLFPRMLHPHLP